MPEIDHAQSLRRHAEPIMEAQMLMGGTVLAMALTAVSARLTA